MRAAEAPTAVAIILIAHSGSFLQFHGLCGTCNQKPSFLNTRRGINHLKLAVAGSRGRDFLPVRANISADKSPYLRGENLSITVSEKGQFGG